MNLLDWLIVVVLVIGTLLGSYWGAIRQVLAIVGVLASISIAGRTYPVVAERLGGILPTAPDQHNLLAFVLVLIVVSAVISLLATLLRRFAGLLLLGWLDRLVGGGLGLIQSMLFLGAIVAALTAFPAVGITEQVAGSRLAPILKLPVQVDLTLLPQRFQLPNRLMFDL